MPRTPNKDPNQPTVFFTRGTDSRVTGGFTQVPNCVLRSRTLSSGAKVLYGVLLSYAWQDGACHPDQATMAADLGCTDRQVRNWLKELEEEHLVHVHRRGLQRSNLYEIMPIETPDRKNISGQDRKYISAPDRNQRSAPPKKDPGAKDSSVIVRSMSDRHTVGRMPDDDVRTAGEDADLAEQFRAMVRTVAPKAVPGPGEATAFIQACGGLSAAITAMTGAADRHRRTKKAEAIVSWQFFLSAAERRAVPKPTAPRTVPCPACAGRGFEFDGRGDLAPCATCHGTGSRPVVDLRRPEQVGSGRRGLARRAECGQETGDASLGMNLEGIGWEAVHLGPSAHRGRTVVRHGIPRHAVDGAAADRGS